MRVADTIAMSSPIGRVTNMNTKMPSAGLIEPPVVAKLNNPEAEPRNTIMTGEKANTKLPKNTAINFFMLLF